MTTENTNNGGLIVPRIEGAEEKYLALRGAGAAIVRAQKQTGETASLSTLSWAKPLAPPSKKFSIDDGFGNLDEVETITGILVLYRKRAILWPSENSSIEGTQPVLISDDHPLLNVARRGRGDDLGDIDPDVLRDAELGDGAYDIRPAARGGRFPYTEFGSSGKGRGCRMKEQRVISIVRENDIFPIMLNIGPGSLGDFKRIMPRIPCNYWGCIITLSLENAVNPEGQKYNQVRAKISPKFLIDEAQEIIRRSYVETLTGMITSGVLDDKVSPEA